MGSPIRTTITPLRTPARRPARRHATKPSQVLPVTLNTSSKAVMPMAMIDGNDRSISPVITIMVRGMAISAKNGVVDMKAT